VIREGTEQGWCGAEGKVLQVENLDLAWIDRLCECSLKCGDVTAERVSGQALPRCLHQLQTRWYCRPQAPVLRGEHEGPCGQEGISTGVQVEEEFDASAGARERQVEGCDDGGVHARSPGFSS
jgi:hypothetical protein